MVQLLSWATVPPWLDTAGLHGYLLERPAVTAADHRQAARRYAQVVADAQGIDLWEDGLRQQIYLGDAEFVDRMQAQMDPPRQAKRDIPKAQRLVEKSLAHWLQSTSTREEALYRVHTESGLPMTALARELGLSVSRISRLIAKGEQAR